MKLQLGQGFALPLDAVTQKLAFLGRTGSGKTYAATKLAEEMIDAGAQVVAVDPVGVWYGLRLNATGKGPGISIPVFGGLHGDVPLEAAGGKMIADLLVDRGISAVLDVSQFEHDTDRARFAADLAARLFYRKKAAPAAIHLFLEECQEFVPQNPARGEEQMLHAFNRVVRQGRNFGIGASLISQRPQDVNKKALNQAECVFAFQLTGPHERKAVDGWISDKGLELDIAADLPKLAVGHAHVWSPSWLQISKTVAISTKRTFNASSTPEVGKRVTARELAPIELEQLRKDMAATIERAKAEDPRELRREVAALKAKLAAAEKAKPVAAPKVVEVPVIPQKTLDELDWVAGRVEAAAKSCVDKLEMARTSIDEIVAEARKAIAAVPRTTTATGASGVTVGSVTIKSYRQPVARPTPATGNGHAEPALGNTGARRMLVALAQHFPEGLTSSKLSILTGISQGGGTWRTYLAQIRSAGWVQGSGRHLVITDAGLERLGSFDPLPTGPALIDYWRGRLGETGMRRILDVLVDAYPKPLAADEVAARSGIGMGGGTWRTYLAKLRALELVEGRGELRASEVLFA